MAKVIKNAASVAKKNVAKKNTSKKVAPVAKVKKEAAKNSVKQTAKKTVSVPVKKSIKTVASKAPLKKVAKKSVEKNKNILTSSKSATAKSASVSIKKQETKNKEKDKKNNQKPLAKKEKVSKMQRPLSKSASVKKSPSTTVKNNNQMMNSSVSLVKPTPSTPTFKTIEYRSQNEFPQEVVDPGFLSNDDVFDEADHAQWQQLREQAAIHERALNLNKPETHPDFNGEECIECGDVIPPARLALQKIRCIDCQSELESLRKRDGGPSPRSGENSWDKMIGDN